MRRGLVLAGLLAATAAGCGSSRTNDEASRAAGTVIGDAERAALASSTVHVVGHSYDGATPLTLDLWLARGKGKGHFAEAGAVYDAVRIGGRIWVRGNAAFVRQVGSGSAGHWLRGSAASGRFAAVASLLDRTAFLHSALEQHGTIVNKGARNRNGARVIEIRDTTQSGSLFVAATGTPYPVALAGAAGQGTVEFRDWNRPVVIAAPKQRGSPGA